MLYNVIIFLLNFFVSKAIELTCLTRVAQDAKQCMACGAIEGNRTHPFASGSTGCQAHTLLDSAGCQALHGLGCNPTHPFDSGSTGCQALHGLGCNRTHPFDSGSAVPHGLGCNRRRSNSPV